jgi:TolB-like protein/class 3 adenylate cyclase/Tfp pilus assembly protein PilF
MEGAQDITSPTRELAAIMFSDVVGYTALMGRDEREGLRAVREHREHLRAVLPQFNGRLIGEIGDGTLSSFHSAVDAVNCARELQANLVEDPELRLRIGIHVGDVVFTDKTVLGDGVNIASRIHELAPPGGCCISERVYEEIRNKPEFHVQDLGEKHLKNVARPIRAYALTAADAPGQLRSPPVGEADQSTHRKLLMGVGALLIIAIVGISTWKWKGLGSGWLPAGAHTSAMRSIAVLPLENLSHDPAQEYFADGMTDELITDLAKISGLRVISRTSVMKFKGEYREQLPEIAKALNVNTIVEGSVLRVGDKVRITAQLIDAPTDKHLWAESYERDTRDVLTLQDEVASTIAQQIDVELTPKEQARFAEPRPVNPAALEACLKGRYFLLKQTSDGFQKASEYFAQAIKIAPDFAVGYAGLAAVYVVAADVVVSNQEVMPKAKDLLATALRLDNTNADAHSLLGTIHWSYDYDWVASERENLRAIELAPSNADTHGNYGFMLFWQARLDEAERELKLAQELDPLYPWNYVVMGMLREVRGDHPKALEQCHRALEIDPNFWPAYNLCLGFTYDRMENHGEALKAFERGVAVGSGLPLPIASLAAEYARSGNREQARKTLEQLNHLPAQTYVAPCYPATAYVALGENSTALDFLEKAYQERSGCVTSLKVFPDWDPLRSDPRFIALLKNVGLDK